MALNHHGDIAVEALQPLLIQTLQDIVSKVWDRHLEGLGHGAPTHTAKGSDGEGKEKTERKYIYCYKGWLLIHFACIGLLLFTP